jgi:branched-chain amino acid transport system ATP-binding protein
MLELEPLADRRIEELAYGERRLVELALALAGKPKVLLLDEPAAGVPKSESSIIMRAITRLPADLAILFIEHDMDLVFRFASEIVVLVAGEIMMVGTPAEVSADERVKEIYFGKRHNAIA